MPTTRSGREVSEEQRLRLPDVSQEAHQELVIPEWLEGALQVVSFGAYTPRSAERAAHAVLSQAVSAETAGAQHAGALHPTLPQSVAEIVVAPRATTMSGDGPSLAAKKNTAPSGSRRSTRVKAREAARAASVAQQIAAVKANGGDDSSDIDEIIKARESKMARLARQEKKTYVDCGRCLS